MWINMRHIISGISFLHAPFSQHHSPLVSPHLGAYISLYRYLFVRFHCSSLIQSSTPRLGLISITFFDP